MYSLKRILPVFALLIFIVSCRDKELLDSQDTYVKVYPQYKGRFYHVEEVPSGGLIIVGQKDNGPVLLLHTDEFGNSIWEREFAIDVSEIGPWYVQVLNNRNYMLLSRYSGEVIIVTSEGDLLDKFYLDNKYKDYAFAGMQFSKPIIGDNNNLFIAYSGPMYYDSIVNSIQIYGGRDTSYVAELDHNGTILGTHEFPVRSIQQGLFNDFINIEITRAENNNLYFMGTFTPDRFIFPVVEPRAFGMVYNQFADSIIHFQYLDERWDYVFADVGNRETFSLNSMREMYSIEIRQGVEFRDIKYNTWPKKFRVEKWDAEMKNAEWRRTINLEGQQIWSRSIAATGDNGVVACSEIENSDGDKVMYLVKLSPDGKVIYEEYVDILKNPYVWNTLVAKDGSIYVVGNTYGYGISSDSKDQCFLVRSSPTGQVE